MSWIAHADARRDAPKLPGIVRQLAAASPRKVDPNPGFNVQELGRGSPAASCCGQHCVRRCNSRSVSATLRHSDLVSGGPPSKYFTITRPSTNRPPSMIRIGTGTLMPPRSRGWSSSIFHATPASLPKPRRPTAICPLTRTRHTSSAAPPANRSIRHVFLTERAHPNHRSYHC